MHVRLTRDWVTIDPTEFSGHTHRRKTVTEHACFSELRGPSSQFVPNVASHQNPLYRAFARCCGPSFRFVHVRSFYMCNDQSIRSYREHLPSLCSLHPSSAALLSSCICTCRSSSRCTCCRSSSYASCRTAGRGTRIYSSRRRRQPFCVCHTCCTCNLVMLWGACSSRRSWPAWWAYPGARCLPPCRRGCRRAPTDRRLQCS